MEKYGKNAETCFSEDRVLTEEGFKYVKLEIQLPIFW